MKEGVAWRLDGGGPLRRGTASRLARAAWPERCSPVGRAGVWAVTRRPCRLAIEALAAVADPVALVAPTGHPANRLLAAGVGAAPPGRPLRLLAVADPGRGPLAALAAALHALPAEHLLVVAGDHPGLRVELLRQLVTMRAEASALACRRGGRVEPLVALYRREPALAAAEARLAGRDHSLRGLLADLGARLLDESEWRPFDPDGRSFVDLDDPAALAAWLQGQR